jgi:hypothetical protein
MPAKPNGVELIPAVTRADAEQPQDLIDGIVLPHRAQNDISLQPRHGELISAPAKILRDDIPDAAALRRLSRPALDTRWHGGVPAAFFRRLTRRVTHLVEKFVRQGDQ